MASKSRQRVSSKQSTGRKRQRELLDSSYCRKHGRAATVTRQTGDGTYKHRCMVCIMQPEKIEVSNKTTASELFVLLMRGC